ncbi:DUF2339 domain-containing protein [Reinekea thalattae]|uniref:DUF2339 domain-containing protein n=1 Tax=Reinekea thalattae TaxID=2593301 RepID=A0A5C8Z2B2_9GAMM|nr:DUF2339 domain-containing protein [Reinekea thalattae]TXR51388.1 DUF2339 domain-containing protein [Reinekea thalattae]
MEAVFTLILIIGVIPFILLCVITSKVSSVQNLLYRLETRQSQQQQQIETLLATVQQASDQASAEKSSDLSEARLDDQAKAQADSSHVSAAEQKITDKASRDINVDNAAAANQDSSTELEFNSVEESVNDDDSESVQQDTAAATVQPEPPVHAEDATQAEAVAQPAWLTKLTEHMKENWMVWLGGFCIAISGIFLVRHSIENDILSPAGRITVAILTGFAFHGAAYFLVRKTGVKHASFATLAGAGSTTIYAGLLAGFHLYDLFSVNLGFVLLALVACATMWLSLFYGSALSAIGILGAYLVPALIGSNSEPNLVLLVYSALVSFSALGVLRYVYHHWLWFGTLAGALLWWLVSLSSESLILYSALYLAVIGYGMLAIPNRDWLLQQRFQYPLPQLSVTSFVAYAKESRRDWSIRKSTLLSFILLIMANAITFAVTEQPSINILAMLALLAVIAPASRWREDFTPLPWLVLLLHLTIAAYPIIIDRLVEPSYMNDFFVPAYAWWLAWSGMACLLCLSAWWNYKQQRLPFVGAALLTSAPLLLLTLAYFATAASNAPWALISLMIGMAYLLLANKVVHNTVHKPLAVWLFIGGHLAYSLAAFIYFNQASFTFALALQIASIAWVIKRFELPSLHWLLKITAFIVLFRLTLLNWLDESPSFTWLVISYAGSTIAAAFGSRLLSQYSEIKAWIEGVTMHLLVLTLWIMSRYFIYQGDAYAVSFSAIEATLNLCLFGAMAMVYDYRSQFTTRLRKIYQLYGFALLAASLLSYAVILFSLLLSNDWLVSAIDSRPVFNILLLGFAGPVALSLVALKYYRPEWRRYSAALFALSSFVFVNIELRHLWQGSIDLTLPMIQGELYSYSAAWLLAAIITILWGSPRYGRWCYLGGMGLLTLVIFKLFIIDLKGLEGLLRVASFMGLGLSLLALAYLHKKLTVKGVAESESSA